MQSSWTPFPRTATQPGAVSRFFGGKRCKTSKIVLRIRNGRKEWRIIGGAILASIHHPGLRFFDEKSANQGDGWVSKMTKFGFSKPWGPDPKVFGCGGGLVDLTPPGHPCIAWQEGCACVRFVLQTSDLTLILHSFRALRIRGRCKTSKKQGPLRHFFFGPVLLGGRFGQVCGVKVALGLGCI